MTPVKLRAGWANALTHKPTTTRYTHHLVAPTPTPGHEIVLHVYGPRADRVENETRDRLLVATPHRVQHHTRPWTSPGVLREHRTITPHVSTRGEKWANLAFIAAFMLVIGVVVYNVAAHPAVQQ